MPPTPISRSTRKRPPITWPGIGGAKCSTAEATCTRAYTSGPRPIPEGPRLHVLGAIAQLLHHLRELLLRERGLDLGRDRHVRLDLPLVVRARLAVVGLLERPGAAVLRDRRRLHELPADRAILDRVAHAV